MSRVYDTDKASDYLALIDLKHRPEMVEALPRRELYGSAEALEMGLEPVEGTPDILLQPDQYEEKIKESHSLQTQPIYHMYNSWRPKGTRYNQDGIGYCWTWGGTGCLMTTRAMEDKPTVLLAPVSMGYLVGWQNRGNYLASFITGARDNGVCPAVDGNFNDLTRSQSYWNNVGQRSKHRLGKVWDTRSSAMTQHCISILCYGRSLYIAYNWWGHALELVGIRMVDGKPHWDISNSHNEPEPITLTGTRAVPSEAYAFLNSVTDE